MKIGSLFSGYEGLGMGVQSVLGGDIAWVSDIDPGACKILAHHYPDVPNIGDITAVDWSAVEPVDVLTAGYPCQPFSAAGKRQGTKDVRHLWPYAAEAIGNLRPEWVVLENVRGHLTLGFDQVLRDLDLLHYEARWIVLRAADVGAPHGRARVFILGRNRGLELRGGPDRRGGVHRDRRSGRLDAAPAEDRHDGQGNAESDRDAPSVRREARRGPTSRGADAGVARLAAEWPEGSGPDREVAAEAAHEGGTGADRSGVPGDGGRGPEAVESLSGLGRGDAPSGEDLPRPDPGGEPKGARPGATHPATGSAAGGAAVRGMVGAGRGSVRTSGVHGPVPDVGNDDRGTHLPVERADSGVFVVAWPAADAGYRSESEWARAAWRVGEERSSVGNESGRGGGTVAADTDHAGRREHSRPVAVRAEQPATERRGGTPPDASGGELQRRRVGGVLGGPTPTEPREGDQRQRAGDAAGDGRAIAADAFGSGRDGRSHDSLRVARDGAASAGSGSSPVAWGPYEPAVRRWERLTRPAPNPTEPGKTGTPRLSPAFVEWLMGLPAGWVTDVPGLTRNEQLKALGNGVVPQQAAQALRMLLGDVSEVAA